MAELGIIPKGALLIHNGVIREVGTTRRVEHLAEARDAREIDASGRLVMPAFVDADAALVTPDDGPENIRLMSQRRLLAKAAARSDAHARHGCLTAGAHTRCASDLKNIARLLRIQGTVQRRPMRICSVFSPPVTPELVDQLISAWLPAVMRRNRASIVEVTVGGPGRLPDLRALRCLMAAAAGFGCAIRLRSPWRMEPAHLELALEAGAVALLAPMDSLMCLASRLTDAETVRVIPVSQSDCAGARQSLRNAIEHGAAVALSSGDRAALNMPHVLYRGVQSFGLTAEEAIVATTWNAACSLRLASQIASFEPDKSADLLVMDVDDYRGLAENAGHGDALVVMREGQIVHRRAVH